MIAPGGGRRAADLREGGAWTPMQRAKNDAIWCAAALALAAARRIPLPVLRALGRRAGGWAHRWARKARRTADANVALALPELDEDARRALVRRTFETLGELLAETVALLGRGERPALLDVSAARATLEEARREGAGVVFASAHLGPWENVAASLVAAGLPLVALARESYDPRFNAVYGELRRATRVRVVWRSGAGAATGIVRTLRRGEILGIPMDLRARVPSVDAPFLGRMAPTPAGPARLALRTGAPVVVGTVAPCPSASTETGGALVVTATRIPTGDLAADRGGTAELTTRINDELSRRIRALPHAWVWMHERW